MRWILLPGMDGEGLFKPFIERLGQEQSVLALSYPSTVSLSYDQLTALVRESLREESDYILIAESFSGPIAIRLAAERPPGLRALVLAASFCRSPVSKVKALLLRQFGTALLRMRLPKFLVRYFLLDKSSSHEMLDALYTAIKKVRVEVLGFRVREILNVKVCHLCASISVPVLYLQGNQDKLVGQDEAQLIGRSCKSFELHQIDAPHMVLQCQPTLSIKLIKDFLSRHKIITSKP